MFGGEEKVNALIIIYFGSMKVGGPNGSIQGEKKYEGKLANVHSHFTSPEIHDPLTYKVTNFPS